MKTKSLVILLLSDAVPVSSDFIVIFLLVGLGRIIQQRSDGTPAAALPLVALREQPCSPGLHPELRRTAKSGARRCGAGAGGRHACSPDGLVNAPSPPCAEFRRFNGIKGSHA